MGNLKEAFDKALLEQADRAAAQASERARGEPLKPCPEILADGTLDRSRQEHCYDDWIVVKAETNSERRATASLERDGFEVFCPAGRLVKRLPLRFVPPKKRKNKHGYLLVDIRRPYPGYLFCRRLFSRRSYFSLFELDGVLGVCMVGDAFARVADFEVEMRRIAQDAGDYDRIDAVITQKELDLATIRVTKAAEKRWANKPRVVGRVDKPRAMIHFIEEFGRITRVVAATGDPKASPET